MLIFVIILSFLFCKLIDYAILFYLLNKEKYIITFLRIVQNKEKGSGGIFCITSFIAEFNTFSTSNLAQYSFIIGETKGESSIYLFLFFKI